MGRELAAAVALTIAIGVVAPAAAQDAGPTLSHDDVAPSEDFATVELGDAWDYDNPDDILTDPNGPTLNVTAMVVDDGEARWSAGDLSYVSPHDMTIPGALPDSRDGIANPIDADRFTRVGMRLWSSERVAGGIQWFVCNDYSEDCFRFHNFTFEQGWNLYDLDLAAISPDWTDDVLGLRLATGTATDLRLDWLRVHDGGTDVAISGNGPFTVDAVPSVGATAFAGAELPTGALAPGTYRVTDRDGERSDPIEVRHAPTPVVLDPDPTGGDDHATVVRGDPWDFSQSSDWTALEGVRDVVLDDGVLQATNTSDQPHVELALGGPVDSARFHRLTVTMTYDGEFDLSFDPGGGSHARVVFDPFGGGFTPISSKELVTYQSRSTATWDLTSNLVGSAVEDGAAAFDDAAVGFLRFDPNEDPGARTWRLDEIRLAADDEADGQFPFRWVDAAHDDDTTVRIGIDRDRRGYDGPVVEVAGGTGERVATLVTDDIRPGRVWPWIEIDDGTDVSRAYARGPLHVTGRIAGADRIETALRLAATSHPRRSDVVVVASSQGFPDALAGVALAAAADAPILLNPGAALDERVGAVARRLQPTQILLLGGPGAMAPVVERDLSDIAPVLRVAGEDRYATSVAIAREARRRWQDAGVAVSGDALLASGTTFPDALAAGQLSGRTATPILLSPPDRLPRAVADALDDFGTRRVVAIGGPGALSDRVTQATGRPVDRLQGPDRYATAAVVRDAAVAAGADGDDVIVASGTNFPDALAAGPVVVTRGGTLLLTDPVALPEAVAPRVSDVGVDGRVIVAGGRGAVADVVLHELLARAYAGQTGRTHH